jgi:hypothetical protein
MSEHEHKPPTLAEVIAEMEKDAEYSRGFPNSMSSTGEDGIEYGKTIVLDKYIAKLRQVKEL